MRLWRVGQPAARTDQTRRPTGSLLHCAVGQRRILSQAYPGLTHGLIFYSFVVFFIVTSLIGVQMDAGFPILKGRSYLLFEVVVNAFALLLLVGLGLAAFRRYVLRPAEHPARRCLEPGRARIHRPDRPRSGSDAPAGPAASVGPVVMVRQCHRWPIGATPTEPPAIYPYAWLTHQLAVFALIATVPFTKFLHIVTSPTNIFIRRLEPAGAMSKIEDVEETEESLGVGSIEQFI